MESVGDEPGRVGVEGYAVVAADLAAASPTRPVRLALRPSGPVAPGEAAAVAPGDPLPAGADTVVAGVNVAVDGQQIEIRGSAPVGANLLRPGERPKRTRTPK